MKKKILHGKKILQNTTRRQEERREREKDFKNPPFDLSYEGQILIKDQFEGREHYCREMR